MANMVFEGLILEKETNIKLGDSIMYEFCMRNTGTEGDISFYAGFGYRENGQLHFVDYVYDIMGGVMVNEPVCPFGNIKITQKLIDRIIEGKDVKFYIRVVPGFEQSFCVTFSLPPEPEGSLEMVSSSFEFTDMSATPITEATEGQEVQANFNAKNVGQGDDDFSVTIKIGSTTIHNSIFSLNINETKSDIFTNIFTMGTSDIDLNIYMYHWDSTQGEGSWALDKTYTKTIYYNAPELCTQYFRIEDQTANPLNGTIVIEDAELQIGNTGEGNISLQKGILYTCTAYVGSEEKTSYVLACTNTTETYVFEAEQYSFTSLIIGVEPSEIGIGQSSTISGGLHIDNTGLILPGLPVKLYVDKGNGFTHIATPNTPANGTGLFEYYYEAISTDASKTISFKWIYEGSDSLKLESSESMSRTLTIESEPVLIETNLVLSANPNVNATPTTVVQLTAYLTDENNNPMPNGSFVDFYKGNDILVTMETNDGYVHCNYESVVEDSLQTITFGAEYLGIENKYNLSEATTNVSFKEYIPIKKCIDHLTQFECETNDCYWHSDNTCQAAPEGTTEYFDIYIKPFSWYDGKYEEVLSKTIAKTAELGGAVANYMTGITGYEYIGIDVLEDQNKNIIIVRIYLKDINVISLVPPLVIGGIVGVAAGILILSIGYIIGTSESEFTKEEVIEIIDDAADAAVEACKERYPNRLTDEIEAKAYADCVGGVDTTKAIADADIVGEDPSDAIVIIDTEVEDIGNGLIDGSIKPEDIDDIVDEKIRAPIDDIVDGYKDIAIDDNCVFDIAGQCIVTKKALDTAVAIGAGIAGLYALSLVKNVTKK